MSRAVLQLTIPLLLAWGPASLAHGGYASLAQGSGAAGDAELDTAARSLLVRRCFVCHGPDESTREAGLRLDIREGAIAPREGRAAIAPGDPLASELLHRIRDEDESQRMPPAESGPALTGQEMRLLRDWIESGAEYAVHWSLVAPERPDLPPVSNADWVRNGIDAFVLARLDAEDLAPEPEADSWTLARRLYLDLIGLPPTPEQAAAFQADSRTDAYERLVDELLASPHYGERWARMWLDLARYADSSGYGSDPLRVIWRYRDWVIEAFNRNLSYDQFTIEQLAGDLLPEPTLEQRLATAFHRNTLTNTEGGTDDEEFRIAAVKDRVSTTMQVWMGLTAGCAECHTHKFDPISHQEYYSLFAIFNQTADTDRPDEAPRLDTPTVEQAAEYERLTALLDQTRSRLANPGHDVAAGQRVWEEEARAGATSWRRLIPRFAVSTGGATLGWSADAVLSASGVAPARDVYHIEIELPAGRWTGLRLEALAHPELPGNGPGRSAGNGNFVLGEFSARLLESVGPPPEARFVRLELPGTGRILSLAEVQVFRGGANVALGAEARQSSVAYAGPAKLAVDGGTSGLFDRDKSITHTETESDPWWEVDLGSSGAVERIVLFNRTDGTLHRRLDGLVVRLLDAERAQVWSGVVPIGRRDAVELEPARHGRALLLAEPTADFSQANYTIEHTQDGDPATGWGIGPRQGSGHAAVFPFVEPLVLDEPALIEVVLRQGYGAAHTLGRLRLSASEHAGPLAALPAELMQALALAPAERDEQATDRLRERFAAVDPVLAELRADVLELRRTRKALAVVSTPVMVELPLERRRETHVLVLGNFLQRAEEVEPGVPTAYSALPGGSRPDRLGLAHWLMDPANPLTARVAVNRFWAQLFGAGLVDTEENFGSQGEVPSHPRLLDWLALEFREGGWDQKALLRKLVLSATYRQASSTSAAKLAADPRNRLLARGARFRLSAETVRDQALAVSGLLSLRIGGPSVYPPQPDGIWQAAFNGQRNWPTSSGEARYRRGLYTYLRRTSPYPSMETFDAPSRETCSLRRLRTNTPLQAFVTLNDPVYVEAAQALARRMLDEGDGTTRGTIRRGLWLCLARAPQDPDIEDLESLFADALTHFEGVAESDAGESDALALATDPLGPLPAGLDATQAAAWTVVANVLLNLDAILTRD